MQGVLSLDSQIHALCESAASNRPSPGVQCFNDASVFITCFVNL